MQTDHPNSTDDVWVVGDKIKQIFNYLWRADFYWMHFGTKFNYTFTFLGYMIFTTRNYYLMRWLLMSVHVNLYASSTLDLPHSCTLWIVTSNIGRINYKSWRRREKLLYLHGRSIHGRFGNEFMYNLLPRWSTARPWSTFLSMTFMRTQYSEILMLDWMFLVLTSSQIELSQGYIGSAEKTRCPHQSNPSSIAVLGKLC